MFFDIHSHILPQVDDGAVSPEETKEMLAIAYSSQIMGIMATPHYNPGMDGQIFDRWEKAYETACSLARGIDPFLKIYRGAEIFYDSRVLKELKRGLPITLHNTRYLLVEFPPAIDYTYIHNAVQGLQYEGYLPILAHIERYQALQDEQKVAELIELGAYMQINANAVLGKYSAKSSAYILRLIKKGYVHLMGTDAHGISHRSPQISAGASMVYKKLGKEYRNQICRENFLRIIKGERLSE